MDWFRYRGDALFCEEVPLAELGAIHGTPLYVYSARTIRERFAAIEAAYASVPHLICYAMKANDNLSIVRMLAERGAGVDIVSGGELFRARRAGVPADRIIFAGVGKTRAEIAHAVDEGVLLFNVESADELEVIAEVAAERRHTARVSVRVNPDVDPRTHPYISTGLRKNKFGIPSDQVLAVYRRARAAPFVEPIGIQMHIGSQLVQVQPIVDAVERLADLVQRLRREGIDIRYLDIGGGLGIRYRDENPEGPAVLAERILPTVRDLGVTLLCEPGRFLVGSAGALLTRVLYRKENGAKIFIIVDAAMNDLIRPALYDAYHEIWPVRRTDEPSEVVDVVGPVCESGDFFAHDRPLPRTQAGDLLAVLCAGAYGFSMASTYNARPRPAEVLVTDSTYRLIRRRETYEDLVRTEEGL
ncbi:MAG TPA: diaminopimelate decarboxylase [Chloroflexota bacterium]|nr:diaminopimelate decarboxylase [Chloroflexota bacterium]